MVSYLLFLYQGPGVAGPSRSRCPTRTMHILTYVDRRIVADDMGNMADVDAARNEIGADEST